VRNPRNLHQLIISISFGKTTAGGTSDTAGAVLDKAINDVATRRATIGAFDKYTLQTRANSIAVSREQLTSAVSMIRDTDYALAATQQSRPSCCNSPRWPR
jgi:flagellin-like hook-associated protein FlgL